MVSSNPGDGLPGSTTIDAFRCCASARRSTASAGERVVHDSPRSLRGLGLRIGRHGIGTVVRCNRSKQVL